MFVSFYLLTRWHVRQIVIYRPVSLEDIDALPAKSDVFEQIKTISSMSFTKMVFGTKLMYRVHRFSQLSNPQVE